VLGDLPCREGAVAQEQKGFLLGRAESDLFGKGAMKEDSKRAVLINTDLEANATGGDWSLTRADYAMTLLDVVEDSQMIGKAVGVCGAKVSRIAVDKGAYSQV
jgi:hypothetical protein